MERTVYRTWRSGVKIKYHFTPPPPTLPPNGSDDERDGRSSTSQQRNCSELGDVNVCLNAFAVASLMLNKT